MTAAVAYLQAFALIRRNAQKKRKRQMPAEMTTPRFTADDLTAMQIHVVIDGIEPPVWRRLVVPVHFTLAQLHPILQAAFGWTDSHLHQFKIGGLRYGDAELMDAERIDELEPRTFDALRVRLKDFSLYGGETLTFTYIYDFGDNWVHRVTLEKLLVARPAPKKAACIEGARSGPPEDVGGPHGYMEFLRVLLTPGADEMAEPRDFLRVQAAGSQAAAPSGSYLR